MRVLLVDPFSGAAGDMFLGALLDLGVRLEDLRSGLGTLGLSGWSLESGAVLRAGIRATKARVRLGALGGGEEHFGGGHLEAPAHDPGHEHHGHGHHGHLHGDDGVAHGMTPVEILSLIRSSGLSEPVKTLAARAFTLLGEAEARVHGTTLDQVHFHEVGAHDAILDICGTALGLSLLGVQRVYCRPLATGRGTFRCAHGVMPIPGPATLALLQDAPILETDIEAELLTPTGAALVRAFEADFGVPPPVRVLGVGYGAGSDDRAERPNVLRLVLAETSPSPSDDPTPQRVLEITFEVDDMTPEALSHFRDSLSGDAVLECVFSPCLMKKGRPGTRITLLVREGSLGDVEAEVFRHSTTFGFRVEPRERRLLARQFMDVDTGFGRCRVKLGRHLGVLVRVHPEADDVARLANHHGVPFDRVEAAARAEAWRIHGER